MSYSTLEIRESAVEAFQRGQDAPTIAKSYGIHRTTVYKWTRKLQATKTLTRKPGSGRPPKLSAEERKRLTKLILKPATNYGFDTDFWTIKRILIMAKKYLDIIISKTTMYEILYTEKFSYKKPESRYYEADKEEQDKWINNTVPAIKRVLAKNKAILYFEDEASISLNSVLGKTWGPIGEVSINKVTANRATISAISAINKSGSLIFNLYETKITSIEVIRFLEQMLKHHPRRHIVVVMDNAPSHTSKATRNFIDSKSRLHVFYLPARSPEFNADEKVWNHLKNEEMKSHNATTKKELKKITWQKLSAMSKKPKLLRAIFKRSEISNFI